MLTQGFFLGTVEGREGERWEREREEERERQTLAASCMYLDVPRLGLGNEPAT